MWDIKKLKINIVKDSIKLVFKKSVNAGEQSISIKKNKFPSRPFQVFARKRPVTILTAK